MASQMSGNSTQPFVQTNIKQNAKARVTGPLWEEPLVIDRWIAFTKGQ